MNYKTMGSAANPLIEIYLNTGEKAKIENGAMVYMQDVAIEGKTNSNGKGGLGGLLKAAARAAARFSSRPAMCTASLTHSHRFCRSRRIKIISFHQMSLGVIGDGSF